MSSRFYARTFFGALIIGAYCFINRGAAETVICSIILSCGLALIIWIPLAYALGWLATFWWPKIEDESASDTPTQSTTSKPQIDSYRTVNKQDRVVAATRDYIRKQLGRGNSRIEIIESLQRAGWSKEFISKQFEYLDQAT